MSSSVPTPATVLEVFDALDAPGTPLTTPEVAEEFECTNRTIYNKLETLADDGALETKKVGARGRVWWRPSGGHEQADGGEPITLNGSTERSQAGTVGHPVSARLRAQKEAFRATAGDAPLEESLNILIHTALEEAQSGVRAAFYVVDDDGSCLHPIAATSDMSDSYIRAIDGLEIGADSLACGQAVHTGEPVLTDDVTEEPRWDSKLDLAEEGDFRGCWSFPIETVESEVVGSFAMYHREPRDATPRDRELADIVTQAAAIIIARYNESTERKQAEADLHESEERLRLATDAAESGVWELDLQTNKFTDRSPRHDEIFGYHERDEWSVETLLDHVHEDDRNQVEQSFEDAFETGEWTVDCRIIRADDEQRWISMQGEFNDDDEGEPVRAVGIVEDITARTERELIEQSDLEQFGAFVRAVKDYAIFMLDPDGTIVSWNDGAERIKGYTEDEIVGEHFSAFYTNADIDEGVPEANLETAAAEGRVEDEGWRVREDGSRFWADVVITAIRDDDGTLQGFTKVTRDRTEQREYEQQLRQERDLTKQIFETAPVGICLITSGGEFTRANQRAHEFIGREEADIAEYSVDSWDLYDAEGDPMPTDDLPWWRVTDTGEPVYDYQCQVDLPDIGRRWLSINAAPLRDDADELTEMVVTLEDITKRKQTEAALKHLNDASRELMDADEQKILDEAAPLMQTVLDVEYAGLWRYDSDTSELHQADECADPPNSDDIRYPDGFDERAWQSFVSEERDVDNDLPPHPDITPAETPLRSSMVLPLGRHGVVCVGSTRPNEFDDTATDLAVTVAAALVTTLDRADREAQLKQQTEKLTRLNRFNTLIREINQGLVEADTREEIDRIVCERVADSDLYEFAWIGEADPGTRTVTPREWSGIDPGYLDGLEITTDETPTGRGPIGTALRTHELQAVEDIATDAEFAPWRGRTLERGARSCVAIPIAYENSLYGVLAVYDGRPESVENNAVLAELGVTIGHAIAAVETRQALGTENVIEVGLELRDPDTPLSRLADRASCEIEFEGLVQQADDAADVFFTACGASVDEMLAAVDESPGISELVRIADRAEGGLYKALVAGPTLASSIIDGNATVRALSIEDGVVTVTVDLPHTVDVREFVESLQTRFPDVTLTSRRRRESPLGTRERFHAAVEERLTDRQQEVLRTAYLSGFFKSPRETTGNELADVLGVSQSTFAQHLRAGQDNHFELLFEET